MNAHHITTHLSLHPPTSYHHLSTSHHPPTLCHTHPLQITTYSPHITTHLTNHPPHLSQPNHLTYHQILVRRAALITSMLLKPSLSMSIAGRCSATLQFTNNFLQTYLDICILQLFYGYKYIYLYSLLQNYAIVT